MKKLNLYIQEKLIIDPEIIDKEKQSKAKLEKLTKDFCNEYPKPTGMWANGTKLDFIAKKAKEIFEKTTIKINVPYHNFNCFGPANVIYHDVYGLMPFSRQRISESEATTLFYGDKKIGRGNYLPFQADSDCYYIEEGTVINGIPTFNLKHYYESFM